LLKKFKKGGGGRKTEVNTHQNYVKLMEWFHEREKSRCEVKSKGGARDGKGKCTGVKWGCF